MNEPAPPLSRLYAAEVPAGLFGSPERAKPEVPRLRATRRKLWELPALHHCVLLGAAFDTRELRQIYRRSGYEKWESASDYALHSSAVNHAKSRNDCSRALQRLLEERFAGMIASFRSAGSGAEVVQRWRDWSARGEAVAAYWAAITHPLTDLETDELLGRAMHMLSHFAFAERRGATRRLRAADERIAGLETALARALARADALQAANGALRAEVAGTRADAELARGEAARARTALDRARHGSDLAERDTRIAALAAERDAALRAARAAQRTVRALEARVAEGVCRMMPASTPSAPGAPDATLDLGRRCILCVGGRTGLVAHYRTAVEGANGVFVHHDGGVEDAEHRLPALLKTADAIVCLAADVSHSAYGTVKRYAKRVGKPCVLSASSSAAALARSLGAVLGSVRAGRHDPASAVLNPGGLA